MAGSKTFLQPILNEVVGDIGTNVQALNESMGAVKNSVDNINTNIPPKIDEQILELQEVANMIGQSVQSLNIVASATEQKILLDGEVSNPFVSGMQAKDILLGKITCFAEGTIKLACDMVNCTTDDISRYAAKIQTSPNGSTWTDFITCDTPSYNFNYKHFTKDISVTKNQVIYFRVHLGTTFSGGQYSPCKAKDVSLCYDVVEVATNSGIIFTPAN